MTEPRQPEHATPETPELTVTAAGVALIRGGESLDARFVSELGDLCAAVGEDDGVRALVLDLRPAVWRGWGDVDEVIDFAALAELPQPTVAAIEGDALGGGLELALCCDLRVAGRSSRLGFPELLDGGGNAGGAAGFPRAGGVQRLSRALGRSRATQLMLLDGWVEAEQALAWGLINDCADDPSEAALAWAERIAERGPIAARYAKDALAQGLEMPLTQALHYETELTILLQSTDDRREGVEAFVEKRPPRFRGG